MLISAPDSAWMALMFLPPGPMSSPILLGVDLHHFDARCIRAERLDFADASVHRGEHFGAALDGLDDGFFEDGEGDAGELEV